MEVSDSAEAETRQARWGQTWRDALHLLGATSQSADALTRADALWLARVLPPSDAPGGSGAAAGKVTPAAAKVASQVTPTAGKPGNDNHSGLKPSGSTALFVPQPGREGETTLAARRVQVPLADALPGRAAIERALRPFLRKRASQHRWVLDAEATAEASARATAEMIVAGGQNAAVRLAVVPVLRPLTVRWFDVALLAEADEAMLAFEETLHELRDLLARHGAFGQVRLWRWSVVDDKVTVHSPSGLPCAPRAMLQTGGTQLVLVLTHGASTHWKGQALRSFVQQLGSHSVLAIVQMLPSRSWAHTTLGRADEQVRGRERAAVNRQLKRRDMWTGAFVDQGEVGVVPMLALQAEALSDWARFVMSPRLLEHGAAAIGGGTTPPPHSSADPRAGPRTPSHDELRHVLSDYKAAASPQAYALLRLLAASWITLPVMRLLLQSLPGPRSPTPLAEVLLSGLLQRVSPPNTPAQDLTFRFIPGLQQWLLETLSSEERRHADDTMAASREAIRRFVEAKSGLKLASFSALLQDPNGSVFLPASAQDFVQVQRQLQGISLEEEPPRPGSSGAAVRHAAAGALPPSVGGSRYNSPPDLPDLLGRPKLEANTLPPVLAPDLGRTLSLRSRVIYGRDYFAAAANGLDPLRYKYRFLAEGDSWMDRSSVATGSLPEFLAKAMDAGGDEVLIVNLSMFGHTMRRIGEAVQGEFAGWIDFWNFDAILLSAAGNDFIGAARDAAPGQGILRDMAGQPLPAQGYDCVKQDAVAALITGYLDPNFKVLYDAVRNSAKNAATPIFLNMYDTPVARDAPAPPGKTAWLFEAYRKNSIHSSLWPDLTDGIFNDVQATIVGWQKDRSGIHLVPTDGTLLPAKSSDKGDSGDWINEIHPNAKGWKKLAKVWRDAIRQVICGPTE